MDFNFLDLSPSNPVGHFLNSDNRGNFIMLKSLFFPADIDMITIDVQTSQPHAARNIFAADFAIRLSDILLGKIQGIAIPISKVIDIYICFALFAITDICQYLGWILICRIYRTHSSVTLRIIFASDFAIRLSDVFSASCCLYYFFKL